MNLHYYDLQIIQNLQHYTNFLRSHHKLSLYMRMDLGMYDNQGPYESSSAVYI